MFEELLPTGLTRAAQMLGVEPLEIVRLMVLSDTVSPGFQVSREHLQKLGKLGGIEHDWWDGVQLPDDTNPHHARIRAALGLLLTRSANGPIRMDNLWRGLGLIDQELIEEALNVLADDEVLLVENAQMGVVVSVPDGKRGVVQSLADGTQQLQALTALYPSE